ncbi:MAG: MBL fold metallo-hydrolase [Candidatus Micrarchaeia archaeon]|jgi:L-ascorbate metabolism protein UlaG (beta-lactamase superfamily)
MRSITYLGHSSFRVVLGNAVMLFNPVVSDTIGGNRRLIKSSLDAHAVRECDMIFLSNEEPGNCEPATVKEISDRCYSSVVSSRPALSKIDVSDRFKVDVRTGDKFNMKGVEVEVQKAIHPQSAYPVGFVVKGDGLSVYHAGDTYSFTDMARIKCDVALVPIGGGSVMDPFAANSIVKEMRPKAAVPMHYNTYDKISQDPNEFVTDLGGITKGVALRVGQELRI